MNRPFWSRRRPTVFSSLSDTCHSIEPLLSLYADGMAAPAERRLVEQHLPHCADCHAALVWMQATHQTLAARPVMAPPADLQARIAGAIAASSSAPIRLRPTRTFTLRPAYAAVASLTILGAVLSVTWMHTLSPISVVGPHTLPNVAVKPSASTTLAVKHPSVIASSRHAPHPHLSGHPSAPTLEHLATNLKSPHWKVPLTEPVQDQQVATAVRTAPALSFVKLAVQHSHLHPGDAHLQMASHLAVTEPKHLSAPLIITPSAHKSVMEAALPKSPPTVPVNIGSPTVTTQPEAPHGQMASDILSVVNAKVVGMRNAGFATVMKSANRTAVDMSGSNLSDGHFYSTIYSPSGN